MNNHMTINASVYTSMIGRLHTAKRLGIGMTSIARGNGALKGWVEYHRTWASIRRDEDARRNREVIQA